MTMGSPGADLFGPETGRLHVLDREERARVLREIGDVMGRFPVVSLGYVFRSFLRGPFHDLDCAVLLSGSHSPYEAMKIARRIEGEIERAIGYLCVVECRVLNDAPVSFAYEVIRAGRAVYVREPAVRIRYEAGLISAWQDYRETLVWFNRRYLGGSP
ncbi:nucleotidyltransferase domain-containing protein [Methanofollis fontis]|nr:nucleotidyltransferase domain-containing protein [Methanofollis fontis]